MKILTFLTCCLAIVVMCLGAYTRLTDAAQACPDWPQCLSHTSTITAIVDPIFDPVIFNSPIDQQKAHIDMLHRVLAALLMLCAIMLFIAYVIRRWRLPACKTNLVVPGLLLLSLALQVIIGKYTVLSQQAPNIVLSHLLLGLFTLACISWLSIREKNTIYLLSKTSKNLKPWFYVAMTLLILQILLGGWTSVNYAGPVCTDFPYCQGQLWPQMTLHALLPVPSHYTNIDLVTIHMAHRLGAVALCLFFVFFIYQLFSKHDPILRKAALQLSILLITQIGLGILSEIWLLPISLALLHHLVSLLMLMNLINIYYKVTHASYA